MSTEDKIWQWEQSLPEHEFHHIMSLVKQIMHEMDKVVQGEQNVDHLIRQLIAECDSLGLPREEITAYIKHKLEGIVPESTIYKHLPKDRKRTYERYHDEKSLSERLPTAEIEVSSSGSSESYTKPDGSEGERESDELLNWKYGSKQDIRVMEEAAANVLADELLDHSKETEELKIRLNEALTLADDKDKRIYELEMKEGELEMKIDELNKKPLRKESDIEKIEELQIENDNLKLRLREVEEIERTRIKESGFSTASRIPKHPWIAAIDALPFYITLRRARDYAINNNDPWRKILFDAGEDGKLSNARLEGENA